ncbi:MAG TPA: phenylacetate--CoA ligase, partial [Treponema sp.]|nr:phenylacetate--CoA ligase [Treponema sp.]
MNKIMEYQYWDKETETLPREELEKLQLRLLRETVERALHTPFYNKVLSSVGITRGEDITSLRDLAKIPFT